ncbi:ribosome biogenesis protein SLX9 homolog [Talpa occidentalis]|uniref:ribosome biogenesis protein SLX9 homolog n=1 Tax=Talpa occidentalis TaxID=50954 RepID=UPI00188DE399|nr:ribosome biogenesis protein SLX9 homolog [Talpa occidentalis]
MGKVRGLRARVHPAAVRPAGPAAPPAREAALPPAAAGGAGAQARAPEPTGIFAGTQIEPGALVQRLDLDSQSVASLGTGAEPKAVLPKKERLRLRRASWLQKIQALELAQQAHRAEQRRRATAVVGDLQPLRDALPELLQLEAGGRRQRTRGARASAKPRPTELSRMSAAQRLQLLEEETTRFQELLASPTYRASPLLAIGEQLAQQLQLDNPQL